MRRTVAAVLAAACAASPPAALAIEGLPGSTWGDLHLDVPSSGSADLILEGWIRQGVAWARWGAGETDFLLQTYATLRYKWDSEGLDWNNYLGPGAGLALDLRAPGGPLVSWGVEYVHQWNDRSGGSQPYTAPFMNWYHWWEIRQRDWPGSTWGDLRWQIPNSGPSNLILQGWIRQGWVMSWWELGSQTFLLGPYLRLRYNVDSEGLSWNNTLGPGVGLAVDMDRPRGPLLSCGVEYSWEKALRAAGGVHRATVFVRWYAWWDLLGK